MQGFHPVYRRKFQILKFKTKRKEKKKEKNVR
jgi:hypothetical protein